MICTLNKSSPAYHRPLPDARRNPYTFREHDLGRFLNDSTLADKGYVGLDSLAPAKKSIGEKLSKNHKLAKSAIIELRSVIERVIAQVKT